MYVRARLCESVRIGCAPVYRGGLYSVCVYYVSTLILCIGCACIPLSESIKSVGAAIYGGSILYMCTPLSEYYVSFRTVCSYRPCIVCVCVLCLHMHKFGGEYYTCTHRFIYTCVYFQ